MNELSPWWLAVVAAWGLLEFIAVLHGKRWSFTAHVRKWFRLAEPGWGTAAWRKYLLLALLGWLPLHFFDVWKF